MLNFCLKKGKRMDFTKLSAVAAMLAFGFVACDSDSSSGPQDSPVPTNSQEGVPASSDDVGAPLSSDAGTTLSSSSEKVTLPNSSSAQCYKEGMANITMRNMERRNITCPNSMTIYDYDLQIFYKCEGSALIEIDMAPCESDEPQSSASIVTSNVEYGTLADSRDGKSYKTVVIGGKTWMAENLNFATDSSFCYDDVPANCAKYGRLYQEFDAEEACPEGWALPTESDWSDLVNAAKTEFGDNNGSLRAVGEWENTIFGDNVVATNASGFSAVPGGYRASTGECDGEGKKAYFWGVSGNTLTYAWILSNQYDMDRESGRKGYFAYSIRCVSSK